MNCFEPFSTYPPSTFSARVRIADASEPASASVSAKAPIMPPDSSSGRKRACCSTLPSFRRPETMRLFWIEMIVDKAPSAAAIRSEEHTSELQSLMRISYAVFCLKKKKKKLREDNVKKQEKIECNK